MKNVHSLSEMESGRKLEGAWPSRLIQRSCRSETLIQQQCGLTKERVTHNRINKAKGRMVEEVKRLGAELQIQPVVKINLPPDCSVDLKVAETS